ncbi:MAG: hypothetical protein WCC21_04760 [Candidatus Acidiferrales bacterium]
MTWLWKNPGLRTTVAQTARKPHDANLLEIQQELSHLEELVPSQSHSMTDVGFQFSNLWFAGTRNNWPLATFFLNESRQHIRWTIRIRPIRKSPSGDPVDLEGIFDPIDGGVLVKLQQAIDKKDSVQFAAAYKETLAECYSCHKASGKPFLRPMVPTVPPQNIINYDPSAVWPE